MLSYGIILHSRYKSTRVGFLYLSVGVLVTETIIHRTISMTWTAVLPCKSVFESAVWYDSSRSGKAECVLISGNRNGVDSELVAFRLKAEGRTCLALRKTYWMHCLKMTASEESTC